MTEKEEDANAVYHTNDYFSHIRGPITKLAKLTYLGVVSRHSSIPKPIEFFTTIACVSQWIGEIFGYPEFGSRSNWKKFVSNLFCQNAAPTQFICSNLLFLVAGFSRAELNTENLTVIIGHVPAGAFWKQLVHYGQGYINAGHFRQYDYADNEKNLRKYNSRIPPDYQLGNITTPIALFSSNNDWLATTKDVELLVARLNSVVLHHKIPMYTFNHYDFIWGKSSLQTVSRPILLLSQYQ
ncbi:PREDICTED: gastric triacylglycerol lipase-like [Dinoponera quadriceps]|uniref:Gastric triacylglycerol lipase-like n=1 Tax=Dinoponera quadriceps TaxID=609295 RepID=A0A6P3Y811_DINQU|nr:PREDICTED: gastric triacylglycerol lipase-like [Dinoponera quadriceps]